MFRLDASHLFMNVSCERNRNGQNLSAFLFVSDISRCIGLKFGILFYNHSKKKTYRVETTALSQAFVYS